MTPEPPADIPSPVDLQQEADAIAWAESANALRPWRLDFFQAIAQHLPAPAHPTASLRILELGSGPGFLAECILQRHPAAQMVLVDFSAPMHRLARQRLQAFADRVTLVERSFKQADWPQGLGLFDAVVTNQSVHELRHRRHTLPLHRQVRGVLRPGGVYLMSDHFLGPDGMQKEGVYLTVAEQQQALREAGFSQVDELLHHGGMTLQRAC